MMLMFFVILLLIGELGKMDLGKLYAKNGSLLFFETIDAKFIIEQNAEVVLTGGTDFNPELLEELSSFC